MNRKVTKTALLTALLVSAVCIGFTHAQDTRKETGQAQRPKAGEVPAVTGDWTGDWGMYSPPPKTGEQPPALKKMMYPETCKQLDCKVEPLPDGRWQAT